MKGKSTPIRNCREKCCNHRRPHNLSHHGNRYGQQYPSAIAEGGCGSGHPNRCRDESGERGRLVITDDPKEGY